MKGAKGTGKSMVVVGESETLSACVWCGQPAKKTELERIASWICEQGRAGTEHEKEKKDLRKQGNEGTRRPTSRQEAAQVGGGFGPFRVALGTLG